MSVSASAARLSGKQFERAKEKLLIATDEVCRALGYVNSK